MIIGFDGSRAFSKNRTGTENYSYQLLLNLAKIDIENHYIVYVRPGSLIDQSEWPTNFEFKTLNYPRLWTQVGLAISSFLDPIDILFSPAHTIPLIRRPFLKTVMTVHDLGSEYLPFKHQLKQALYLKFITKFQLKSSTKLIAVSQATKEDLIDRVGVDDSKVRVVYEAVDRDLFLKVNPDKILKKFNLKSGRYLFFVSTIQPRKNLERLIEAYAQLYGTNQDASTPLLVLAGSKGWLSDSIYELPKKLGVSDQVLFLGRVEDSDLPPLYSGAIALVFPSLFEGFGLPIVEAFSCECPVLTSNASSMKEIADSSAILVDPYDILSISNGIKRIMEPKKRVELIKLGLDRVKDFSWERAAKETLEVLLHA